MTEKEKQPHKKKKKEKKKNNKNNNNKMKQKKNMIEEITLLDNTSMGSSGWKESWGGLLVVNEVSTSWAEGIFRVIVEN